MEKLLRRSILTRNQLVKRKRQQLEDELRVAWREFNRTKNRQATAMNNIIKQERKARREDWMLGPLAPRRDVGMEAKTYGAVSNEFGQGATLPQRERGWPKGNGWDARGSEDKRIPGFEDGEWRGEGLVGNLVVGDRVVVVKGRLGVQGKIGEVSKIEQESNLVFIKDVNRVDMRVPPQATATAGKSKIFEQELPIPLSDVLLVTQLPHPTTGVLRDVIVRHLYGAAPYLQRTDGSNLPRHTRYIKNATVPAEDGTSSTMVEDLQIEWPEPDPDKFYAFPNDTTRSDVEKITYVPSLIDEKPMPDSVIDELRGKHARNRREWDDHDWMRKKLLEDARRDWFAERSKVLSQPFWTREFLLREKKAKESSSSP